MPKGFVSVVGVHDGDGKHIPLQRAVDLGWIKPGKAQTGWGLSRDEIPLGPNLFVDNGRQLMTYLFGGRAPVSNYFCQRFGMGTGTTPAAVTDLALESSIDFGGGVYTKLIDSVDFTAPYIARVSFTIGAGEGNGYLITEFGLFTSANTLFARLLTPGLSKVSDFRPTYLWRLRF
jgi:hypothetical protein